MSVGIFNFDQRWRPAGEILTKCHVAVFCVPSRPRQNIILYRRSNIPSQFHTNTPISRLKYRRKLFILRKNILFDISGIPATVGEPRRRRWISAFSSIILLKTQRRKIDIFCRLARCRTLFSYFWKCLLLDRNSADGCKRVTQFLVVGIIFKFPPERPHTYAQFKCTAEHRQPAAALKLWIILTLSGPGPHYSSSFEV